MKQIVVTKEVRELLKKEFSAPRIAVYRALNYRSNNDRAIKIRERALQEGGQIVGEDSVITYHDSDDTMVQKFGTRIELVLWKQDDKVQIYIDGIWKEEHIGMSIDEFMKLQDRLTEKAKTL